MLTDFYKFISILLISSLFFIFILFQNFEYNNWQQNESAISEFEENFFQFSKNPPFNFDYFLENNDEYLAYYPCSEYPQSTTDILKASPEGEKLIVLALQNEFECNNILVSIKNVNLIIEFIDLKNNLLIHKEKYFLNKNSSFNDYQFVTFKDFLGCNQEYSNISDILKYHDVLIRVFSYDNDNKNVIYDEVIVQKNFEYQKCQENEKVTSKASTIF